ncbi:MAG: DsrE family protein [Desulfomonile tiedjei]|nr:DsrE family protein [Desulfomonile tiedjei]
MTAKVVFHIDWDQEDGLLMALNNIRNLLKEVPEEDASIFIVANGSAVNLFLKDRAVHYVSTIEELHKAGARFLMCRNSITNLGLTMEDLIKPCERVPAGIVELIRLQQDGYAYVKP